jgi:ribosome biogenesis GTPase / thiamine phosphate phosphatase
MPEILTGIVLRSQSGFYTVHTQAGQLTCRLRGRLVKGKRLGDVIAVGDQVQIQELESNKGIIEEILPRQRIFARLAPRPKGEYRQILIANPDQVVMVFSCARPSPRYGMLDRFLVIAEKQAIPVLILVNKVDLVGENKAQEMFQTYVRLGYRVVFVSARTGFGMVEFKQQLVDKISLFTGPSGAGKTSLLNALQPGLGLTVRKVSDATSKGRHTTVVREMFPLEAGGYVADTPGLKALALWDIKPEELDGYFLEIGPLVKDCQFSDCTHVSEPGCAVREAVQEGLVDHERYLSYLKMRFGEIESEDSEAK